MKVNEIKENEHLVRWILSYIKSNTRQGMSFEDFIDGFKNRYTEQQLKHMRWAWNTGINAWDKLEDLKEGAYVVYYRTTDVRTLESRDHEDVVDVTKDHINRVDQMKNFGMLLGRKPNALAIEMALEPKLFSKKPNVSFRDLFELKYAYRLCEDEETEKDTIHGKWFASTNEEYWSLAEPYNTKEDAIKHGPEDLELEEEYAVSFYVGKAIRSETPSLQGAKEWIESNLIEHLHEEIDLSEDVVSDWPEKAIKHPTSQELLHNFLEALKLNIQKNVKPSFYNLTEVEEVATDEKETNSCESTKNKIESEKQCPRGSDNSQVR